jgi:D-arabinonate dehydratase
VTAARIAAVEAANVRVPLAQPIRNATNVIALRDYLIVRVRCAGGVEGVGFTLSDGADLARAVSDLLAPLLIDGDVCDSARLWRAMRRRVEARLGQSGAFLRALSAVDIALWDARAILAGVPLAALLGSTADRVPALAAAGYYRATIDVDETHDEYAALADTYARLKMMIGGAPVEDDLARLEAARRAIGSRATLAVDVNGAWAHAREAASFLDQACDLDLDFVEEPFRPGHLAALQTLRERTDRDLAIGEWESGLAPFRELVERRLVDVMRPDATAVGGITEWLRVAALAEAFDCRLIPHYFPALHAHLVAATAGAEAVELVPASAGASNFSDLHRSPLAEEDGSVLIPDVPGIGIAWDWRAVDRYAA